MASPSSTAERLPTLDVEGLRRFQKLQTEAVNSVSERFYSTDGSAYERFGPSGRAACRDDLASHLEFLEPVLEFGFIHPMIDYLRWLDSVLGARAIPTEHLSRSLDWLAEFFAGRMDAADGAVVVAALHAARTKYLEEGATTTVPLPTRDPWPEAAALEVALLAGNRREASALINRCLEQGRTLVEVELHIIQPALYQIGEKWQANQVSVAQEHLASAIAQSLMTMGLLRSPPSAQNDKRVLLACVQGNNHAIGLQMVADAFQIAGWDTQYLGANVPTPGIIKQAVDWSPDLVGLSVSFPQQLRAVKDVIAQLKTRLGRSRPLIIVGGLAINRFNPLAKAVGADGSTADAQEAVTFANLMVGR